MRINDRGILNNLSVEDLIGPALQAADGARLHILSAETNGGQSLRRETAQLYRRLLLGSHAEHLYRIWNIVPHINSECGGLECYRHFNAGRAEGLTGITELRLPPASAVGSNSQQLFVIALSAPELASFFESPLQVPAYFYPAQYGPRSPQFSRAGILRSKRHFFLSGTASIRGHKSLGIDNVQEQCRLTLENVAALLRHMQIVPKSNFATCYLRQEADLPLVRTAVEAHFERVQFVVAELCRKELLIEIELQGRF